MSLNMLKDLEYIWGDYIFKTTNIPFFAYTTQSRLRREKANILSFLDEIETKFGGASDLKIKNSVKNNNKVIDMDLLTSTPPQVIKGKSKQGIIDGWSRFDMNITFLLACLLYHRFKGWNRDLISIELEGLFKVGDEMKFQYLPDSKKLDQREQVNFNLPLFVCGLKDINLIKTFAKQKRKHQINMFCMHVETSFNRLKKWKISSPEQLQNVYNNVLRGQKFCSKFVPENVDASELFYNKNIKAVNLTPECSDTVRIFDKRKKYSLPDDDTLYSVIDDYLQELAYWIREDGESVTEKNWFRYIGKSQISAGSYGNGKPETRSQIRREINEKLREQYLSDKKVVDYIKMTAKLDELSYGTDFKNIHTLKKMKFKSNLWPLCLKLMRNDLFDDQTKRFLFNLTRFSDFIDSLWKGWDQQWLQPLLEDKNLLNNPTKTIHNHLVKATFGTPNDIRERYANDRVRKKVGKSDREALTRIDCVQGLLLGGQFDEIRAYYDAHIDCNRKYVESIEHPASQGAESDPKTECVDLGANQYFAGKRDNSKWSNKDYIPKREAYERMRGDLPNMLRLVMFGPDGLKIRKEYKDICSNFNGTWDVSDLDKWNSEIIKPNSQNKFYKFHRFMANDLFDYDFMKKYTSA